MACTCVRRVVDHRAAVRCVPCRSQHRYLPDLGGSRAFQLLRLDLGAGAEMRLVPNTDTVPASVNRYLLPHERQVITVHQHPAVLIRPVFEVLVGLALAGWLTTAFAKSNGVAVLVIWVLWGILFLRLAVKGFELSETYFVVTSQRFILATGLLTRKGNMMPLAKATDMSCQRSTVGRSLGSGEFILECAGQDQALTHVDHLPYPEQLYL